MSKPTARYTPKKQNPLHMIHKWSIEHPYVVSRSTWR